MINGDPIYALVQSTFGCLFFAICGRMLLTFFLNGTMQQDIVTDKQVQSQVTTPSSSKIDPMQQSSIATTNASIQPKPLVQAKA